MNSNKLILVFLLLLFFTQVAFCQLSEDSIRYVIKREVDNKRSPSITIGVIDNKGKKFFSYGKLNVNEKEVADSNTIYEIGSITKIFTCLLLADMVLKNEVRLDDPISKYLNTSVIAPKKNGKQITLLDLATHTSGLPRLPDNLKPKDYSNPYTDYTIEDMYDFLSTYTLSHEIGTHWEYSNIGMQLLGHVLSLAGNSDYETLLKERIFKPLKMNRTFFTASPLFKENFAVGHNQYEKPVPNWDEPIGGDGGIKSTAQDLLTFAGANLGIIHSSLDSAIRLTKTYQDSTGIPSLSIGLGWLIWDKNGKKLIWHNGGTGGYRAYIGLDSSNKKGVITLCNSENSSDDIALHILDSTQQISPYYYKWTLKDTLDSEIRSKGISKGVRLYHKLKKASDHQYSFDEEQLNNLGYELLFSKKISDAISIFQLNTKEYPSSSNTYDSLGEAYLASGNKKLAIKNYQKSVELDPNNLNGIKILNTLRTNIKSGRI